jgi:hypothetical protein
MRLAGGLSLEILRHQAEGSDDADRPEGQGEPESGGRRSGGLSGRPQM